MIVAVDVGGTKTLIAAFDGPEPNGMIRNKTNPSYPDFLKETCHSIQELIRERQVDKIVVGLPGLLDRENGIGIAFGHFEWKNIQIVRDMREELGFEGTIVIENDANLAGLAESQKHLDRSLAVYVTISTGIGTGVTKDGRLHPDLLDTEGGHMLIHDGDQLRRWDHIASGKAIVEEFHEQASEIDDQETWDKIADELTQGISAICALLQPDIIIFGGSVGVKLDNYKATLSSKLRSEPTHLLREPLMTTAAFGDQSVLYGCYYLATSL